MPNRIKDELSDILLEDEYEGLRDRCSISGAVHFSTASKHAIQLAQAQNHRGDKGVGISSNQDGKFHQYFRFGTVQESIRRDFKFSEILPGTSAVAHTRYATLGNSGDYSALQPIVVGDSKFGPFTISHNGQLVENNIREKLLDNGAILASTSDSALIPHIMTQANKKTIESGISHFMKTIDAAYSLLIQTPTKTIAVRDRHGIRPLHYAKMEDGWLIASESSAFRTFINASYVDQVKPGEMIIFDNNIPNSIAPQKEQVITGASYMPCIFERIYFSEPRSKEEGIMHQEFRRACGRQLVRENKELFYQLAQDEAIIVPILDSGKDGAIGVRLESELNTEDYFLRRHNAPNVNGRSYTQPTSEERERRAYAKLDLLTEDVKGKTIVTVDDSVVRSTTAQIFNERLNKAGAKKVVNVVVSPMVRDICFLGMNHQDASELAANKYKTESALARAIGSDEIIYLSQKGLQQTVQDIYGIKTFCGGCFGMEYPTQKPEN